MGDPAEPSHVVGPVPTPAPYSPNAVHLLRTVQVNSLGLSQMADQKASILMGATLLVFSITLSRSLDEQLPKSLLVLAAFAFCSSLCAVIAVLPSLGKSPPAGAKPNRMFFAHFHHLAEEDWTRDVLGELHDDETVFRMMLHDIYQSGQVLERRKYRFLSYAYRLLVAGLLTTLAAFAVEMTLA